MPNNASSSQNSPHLDSLSANETTYPCPRCQTPTTWADNPFKPFCSKQCKWIDFGDWTNEEYRLPSQEAPFSDER